MLKNYLAVAFRNILRNKLFAFVNIAGLSFGLASALLIFLWIGDELAMDQYHKKGDRLYRVMENQKYTDGKLFTFSSTPAPMAPFIKDKFPEIELATRLTWEVRALFGVDDKTFFDGGRWVDQDFLQMVTLKWLHGDSSKALMDKSSIVICRSMAEKHFGTADAVGKVLTMDHETSFTVTGVYEDLTSKSSWKYSFLLPFQRFFDDNKGWLDQWGNNNVRTWILLAEGTDAAALSAKLKGEIKEHNADSNTELFIQRFGDAYLHGEFENGVLTGGRIEYVRIFFLVALFVLLIACINFMNLATAQGARRAKEVGLRKVIGAFPGQLFRQFMGESFLTVAISALIALIFVVLALPSFNDLTGKTLSLQLLDGQSLLIFGGILAVTALLAGTYPAVFVSGYKPVNVLKGQLVSGGSAAIFRKALVVVQFSLSIILIVCTVVVFRQMNFMQDRDIGFDRNNVFYVWMQGDRKVWPTFRQELENKPGISNVTVTGQLPIDIGNSTYGVEWPGKKPDDRILFTILTVDPSFVETMKMTMKEGRAYERGRVADSAGYIVNEVAAAKFGLTGDLAGQPLTVWGRKGSILGVVRNFNFGSLHNEIEPLVIRLPDKDENIGCMLIRAEDNKTPDAIASVESLWKTMVPGFPMSYRFLSDNWDEFYAAEGKRGSVFNALAILSIAISALGLFGLSAFSATRRTKELGIRKVLGASIPNLAGLMGKEFLVLVIVAAAVGCPIGWYLMDTWLSDYAYHVEVGWLSLVLAAVSCLAVSMLTVSYHSMKASRVNPVTSLRYE